MHKRKSRQAVFSLIGRGILLAVFTCSVYFAFGQTYPFQDPGLPLETRVTDLVSRLTQAEKIALLHQWQPAIPRLGIASFRTGTEGLHGVAWLGAATVFPQALGLATSWDRDLVKRVASAIGDEVRAFHKRDPLNVGLSVWAPVVDLLRDPRAGRTEEGYAEDPFLTGQISIAYCNGLKGDDPFYYKTIPTLKHFYAYNQEANRATFNVVIDARNKYEYYLESFRYAVAAGAAKSLMTSYNLVNGVPNTANPDIRDIVKAQWVPADFFVVTDAYAPNNLISPQRYYPTSEQAHAGMLRAGVDSMTQNGSDPASTIQAITNALSAGLITATEIDHAVRNILRVRFHTGEFDGALDPYRNLGDTEINHPEHQGLAREAVRKSIVLLKNSGNILPLSRSAITSIAVTGKRANEVLTDWYSGTLPYSISALAGIQAKAGSGITVRYNQASDVTGAVNSARSSSVAIVVVGNHPTCNGGWGSGCALSSEGKEEVDRLKIELEADDLNLIQQVFAANPKTIVVLIASFPYAITWPQANVPGIIHLAHGGQELGNGLADVLFGDYNPAGRLTMTWYNATSQIPGAITGYDIINGRRTYMYFDGTPLYPFGYGLSYTSFTYSNLRLSSAAVTTTGQVTVSVDIKNSGVLAGDEVAQLYVKDIAAFVKRPAKELLGFERIHLGPGETRTVSLALPVSELAYWDTSRNAFYVEPGDFSVMVGSSSADIKLTATLTVTNGTTATPTPNGIRGDVNNSGAVDVIDAMLIAQHSTGLNPANFNRDLADVNCSGGIDIVDAMLIAQRSAGLIPGFPC